MKQSFRAITLGVTLALAVLPCPRSVRAQLAPDGLEVLLGADPEWDLDTPSLASDALGRPLACWRSELHFGFVCGLFDDDLAPLRTPEDVSGEKRPLLSFPLAVASNGTDFAVSWSGHGTFNDTVYGRSVGPQGRPAASTRQLSAPSEWYRLQPAVAGTPDGSFLVIWVGQRNLTGDVGIFGRRFSPKLEPQGAEVLLEPLSPFASAPAVVTMPDGGFLIAWAEGSNTQGYFARLFDASGAPAGPKVRLDQAKGRRAGSGPSVGRFGDRILVVWHSEDARFGTTSVRGRVLDTAGKPLREEISLAQREADVLRLPVVAADPAAGFLVVWDGFTPEDDDDLGIIARRFDRDGFPISPDVLVNSGTAGIQSRPAIAALGSGRFAIAWEDVQFDSSPTTIEGRVLAVGPLPPQGAWIESRGARGFAFKVRISTPSGSILGSEEPACIPETVCVSGAVPGRSEVFLRVVGPKPNGFLWPTLVKFSTSTVEVWARQEATGAVRYYKLEGARPGFDELPGLFDRQGFEPVAQGTGASQEPLPAGLVAAEPTVLAAGNTPAPPGGAVFTSPEFPGFRFRARISAGDQVQEVRQEAACIEETLCLSAAIPGRSEVFLRIVGPKPNGRLWPTIVKFTTSTLEVWVEQVSTGETRYYRIEGAAQGKDDLTGLFDRVGFAP